MCWQLISEQRRLEPKSSVHYHSVSFRNQLPFTQRTTHWQQKMRPFAWEYIWTYEHKATDEPLKGESLRTTYHPTVHNWCYGGDDKNKWPPTDGYSIPFVGDIFLICGWFRRGVDMVSVLRADLVRLNPRFCAVFNINSLVQSRINCILIEDLVHIENDFSFETNCRTINGLCCVVE